MKKTKSGLLPLGLRISLYFIVFGIIIGYFSYMSFGRKKTHELIESYSREIHRLIEAGRSPEEILTQIGTLGRGSILDNSFTGFEIYTHSGNSWELHQKAGSPAPRESEDTKDKNKLEKNLDEAAEDGFHIDQHFFVTANDSFSFYIRITGRESQTSVMRLSGSREGILDAVKGSGREFIGFTLGLIILSALVGNFFVRKIVRPINYISREAQLAARGKGSGVFRVAGMDSIAKLARSLTIMSSSMNEQIQRIQKQADAMETMNRIDKAVLSSVSRKDLIEKVTEFTASLYPENGLMLLLKNRITESYDVLYERFGSLCHDHENESIPMKDLSEEVLEKLGESGVYSAKETPAIPGLILDHVSDSCQWILNIPVFLREEHYGSLLVTSDLSEGFSEEDMDIIAKLTDQIGVALQSLLEVEERQSLLMGALKALSATIDAKSRWTAGHSTRVEALAAKIGRRISLPGDTLEELSIAALLHDIGKLSISESVLDKPGTLTEEEYAQIKTHPAKGAEIFSHIPGSPEIVEGILHHHEAWDGSGYPEGLQGEDIPLLPRILCIADVFDALRDDRPYRKGMEIEQVVDFFREKKGTLFDPRLTDILMELIANREI